MEVLAHVKRGIKWYFKGKLSPGHMVLLVTLGFLAALAMRILLYWQIIHTPTWITIWS